MAGSGKAAARLIKYGPLAAAAAQKWGPVLWEQMKNQREPAEKFVQAKVAKGNQRKKAMAHAATVIDGSVLQVFHQNTAHWVVFSGDDPIAVHPPTGASFDELLDRADLSKRTAPRETATLKVPKPRRRPSSSSAGGTSSTPREQPAPGPHTADSPVAPARGRIVSGDTGETGEPPVDGSNAHQA
ncbi:hypothetical protein MWU75_16005 [Ornithinimicrobium sp. F0845]|uniref:hypothetical protein n=1 Tax=Ornithinimicrobium sp. F0845 TaxID=2926412 RepID=UPI001FF21601|nr:hypothetical protein [Ornithinimicrobium sp. F0845]MCK0113651.1 hypothetical protein [Ornithinimicrobium sp. F0845]